jgi:DGQHR domain-containing protein
MEKNVEPETVIPPAPKRPVSYGRVAYPAIGYRMGSRQMITTVMTPLGYIGTVGPREQWDPLTGAGTNRKEDRKHRDGIAQYIQNTEDYVLNSILVYIGPEDANFVPDDPNEPISPGVLYTRPGAKFVVGDGGHRTSAFEDVIHAHAHGDDVLTRLGVNGQPVIVVLDDDPTRRAQDFTDLQNNAKPLNASIAQSMDKRQLINRMLIEKVIKVADIPLLDGGKRIEYLTDSPGRLSSKIMGFKTLRYATGTLLIGTEFRSTRTWDDAVSVALSTKEDASYRAIVEFWSGYGEIPAVKEALSAEKGMVKLREDTWLASANVIYAIAAGVHEVSSRSDREISEIMKAVATIDFSRSGTTLDGTLVDPAKSVDGRLVPAKALTGRDAWEGAAAMIARQVDRQFGTPPASARLITTHRAEAR